MAIAAVVANLFGAVVAYLQSDAIKNSGEATVTAQSLGVQAVVPAIPTVARFRPADFPAMIAGWRSADGAQGLLLVGLNGEFPATAAGGLESAVLTARVAVKALDLWHRAFPGRPIPSRYWRPGSLSTASPAAGAASARSTTVSRGAQPPGGRVATAWCWPRRCSI